MKDESGYFRKLSPDGQFDTSFYCPGCECHHGINTDHSKPHSWNLVFTEGKPSVTPSILVRHGRYDDPKNPESYRPIVCHLFIRNGRIEYLSDCTHHLKGKTVDMQPEED